MTQNNLIQFALFFFMAIGLMMPLAIADSEKNHIVTIGDFSNQQLDKWKEKSFQGNTSYSIKDAEGKHFLQASADSSASALYKRIKVDISKTPYLNWSWQINNALPQLPEQTKDGDDYAARVYVVVKRGVMPWQTVALNYVWSSNPDAKDAWPNAYVKNAIMIPARTGSDPAGEWLHEKIDVRADLKKHLGIDVKKIDGVAIMTDTDNSGQRATAAYGDIYFSSK